MRIRARKIVVVAVAVALAMANGFAPRHAQAGQHVPVTPVAVAKPHHHGAGHRAHHHGEAVEQAAAKAICHKEGQEAQQQPWSPLHNCCVASCTAVAFIFASFNFDTPLPRADYGVFPPIQLTSAALTSDDPPPR